MTAKYYIYRAGLLAKEHDEDQLRIQDQEFANDVMFILKKMVTIVDQLTKHKTVLPDDDALTIEKLTNITNNIGDPDLERYFMRKITEALELPSVQEPLKISKEI